MTDKAVSDKAISRLKARLDRAVSARGELEQALSAQSALLIGFITKLSLACRGKDLSLDNKLAKLRATLKKSTNFSDLEREIASISPLLHQHIAQQEVDLKALQENLLLSALSVQKSQTTNAGSQRQLKQLIDKTKRGASSLNQYLPLINEFILFFQNALLSLQAASTSASSDNDNKVTPENNNADVADNLGKASGNNLDVITKETQERFNSILNTLVNTSKHKADISKVKSSLTEQLPTHKLLTKCLHVFDLVLDELQQERASAKAFLSTLSEALHSVNSSVTSTITSINASNTEHDALNLELKTHIKTISDDINGTNSLLDMKTGVNNHLQSIVKTLAKKNQLEAEQRLALNDKLNKMSAQISRLESESESFEKRIKEQQIKSMQDGLTKLANRAAFDEFFAMQMVHYHHQSFDLAITVIDLDDFKRINDTYGHSAGDKTLKAIAKTLMDVIAEDAFICRYGGEEFVLIFQGFDKVTVINKLNILRKKVASLPFTFKGNRVSISLSLGVTFVQAGDNIHSAFERADAALYRAKHDGKNRVIYG
ncbi:diguanylate cyclase (GGDEF) domain-containing protein [Colwellia chukchiensis]|uniref:diguanylate cyclase n=1 Tax=Colwellia chukchiensis TaxID=641665 RepID=A0A1H7K9N8_9GAMM|nr:diguanylate cyclase [Colwellia chukchiensis]SEK83601.1 diguanylate cyclase (GGDEF) domain-containing protein [Colwellia chukchiensis]